MIEKVKCTAKIRVNRIILTLRTDYRKNEIKVSYQISCGFGF